MKRNFTPLTFSDINTTYIDLIADAYGFEYIYGELFELLDIIQLEPDDEFVCNLLRKL